MNQNKGFPPLSYLSKVFAIDRKQNSKCSYIEGGTYQQYGLIFSTQCTYTIASVFGKHSYTQTSNCLVILIIINPLEFLSIRRRIWYL